jgi:hypothetical protein
MKKHDLVGLGIDLDAFFAFFFDATGECSLDVWISCRERLPDFEVV